MNKDDRMKIIVLLLLAVLVYFFSITTEGKKLERSYGDKIIRLHVIANSNTADDQELKLKVRDEVIRELNDKLMYSKNIEESRSIIKASMDEIEDAAHSVLINNGYTYSVAANLGKTWIPEKAYGNLTLPAGEYEALNVVIGEGKGQNWWCVLFPPLCLIDSKNGEIGDALEALSQELTEDEYQLLVQQSENTEPVLSLKFKTLETAEDLKASIEKIINKINQSTASID